jgi:hypothetical protein
MLAARERAGGGSARAALLRQRDAVAGPATTPAVSVPDIKPASGAAAGVARAVAPSPAAPAPVSAPNAATAPAAPAPKPEEVDTLARLREAKKRARGG